MHGRELIAYHMSSNPEAGDKIAHARPSPVQCYTTNYPCKAQPCTLGRVKNVSKRVFKNPLAFFAAILCIVMGYLAKKGFQRIFDGGKLTSKRGPPIKHRENREKLP